MFTKVTKLARLDLLAINQLTLKKGVNQGSFALRPTGSIIVRLIKNFLSRGDGNIAITFALFSTVLFVAVGGGIDLSRAYNASQELTDVANLGCQYANRPSIVQNASMSGGGPAYVTSVTNFINASLSSQNFPFTQTNSTPFSYVQNGAANVSLTSTVPTVFASIIEYQHDTDIRFGALLRHSQFGSSNHSQWQFHIAGTGRV